MINTPHQGTSPDKAFSLGLTRSQGRLDDARLIRVLAYIEDHLAEAMTGADLAKVACLSVFHFTRAFAAAMDVPPHRYVNQRRIESAKELMATGQTSLSEIASIVGFRPNPVSPERSNAQRASLRRSADDDYGSSGSACSMAFRTHALWPVI